MRHYSEQESERIVLECQCGDMVILLGREEDWRSEGHTIFECECEERLSIADNCVGEDVPADIKQLIRGPVDG